MKYLILFIFLFVSVARAQHIRIYATAIGNDSAAAFMGGSSNGSGLYQSDDTGKTWKHLGWNNLKTYSMDEVQSSNGKILYVATGLGVLRSTDYGESWKQLTDWRISEVMDVAVNQKNPNEIYIATAHGPWRSRDGGKTWHSLLNGLSEPYTSRVVIDSILTNHVLLGAESGILYLRADSIWAGVEASDYLRATHSNRAATAIRSLTQISLSTWIAAGNSSRLLQSNDSGKSFNGSIYGGEDTNEVLWCGCMSSPSTLAESNRRPEDWIVMFLGGKTGFRIEWNTSVDIDWYEHLIDSIRNVHTCLAITDHEHLLNYTSILGTLGDGIFVRNNDETQRLYYKQQFKYFSRRFLVGEQKLAGLQIWTLKSFLVH